jgi:hypothetical protein
MTELQLDNQQYVCTCGMSDQSRTGIEAKTYSCLGVYGQPRGMREGT